MGGRKNLRLLLASNHITFNLNINLYSNVFRRLQTIGINILNQENIRENLQEET